MADNWHKINDELDKRLENFKYSFIQAWKIIGCGEKTLRRYVDAEYVRPIKVSDEWFFTNDMIQKCKFIHKMRYDKRSNNDNAVALYEYMEKHGIKAIYEDIFKGE